jgi:hypothetical protein
MADINFKNKYKFIILDSLVIYTYNNICKKHNNKFKKMNLKLNWSP